MGLFESPFFHAVSTEYSCYSFILGVPTRYGNMPAQFRAFFDATGSLWSKGALAGKYAAIFFSTATMSGGQESTALLSMSTLAHHGIIFVVGTGDYGVCLTFAH
jgi:multimeric flavodoxin WrbA